MPADAKTPPAIVRPIPRRPFNLSLTSATPPSDESSPSPGPPPTDPRSLSAHRLRDPRPQFLQNAVSSAAPPSEPGSASLSRAQSIINLTSSTLFGIYGPASSAPGRPFGGPSALDPDDTGTPWGTGAQSPHERHPQNSMLLSPEQDQDEQERDEALERLRERLGVAAKSSRTRLPTVPADVPLSPQLPPRPESPPPLRLADPPRSGVFLSLAAKAFLLFTLGVAYGMLVSRLRDEQVTESAAAAAASPGRSFFPAKASHDLNYITFWGFSGVLLGSLLPWFDHFWDQTFGTPDRLAAASSGREALGSESEAKPETDWALVIRGVGAFAGIVFAIRKLPWASTMQVSLTLALVNPFLWYLIDRSKSGFTLASAVGVVGTAVIAGVDPDMMPTPAGSLHDGGGGSDPSSWAGDLPLARTATVETGIWMLSVLFCSCVCFGNIGRRLALSTSSPGRGRWGGVK